jgi:hypothetical protein
MVDNFNHQIPSSHFLIYLPIILTYLYVQKPLMLSIKDVIVHLPCINVNMLGYDSYVNKQLIHPCIFLAMDLHPHHIHQHSNFKFNKHTQFWISSTCHTKFQGHLKFVLPINSFDTHSQQWHVSNHKHGLHHLNEYNVWSKFHAKNT